MTRQPIRLTCAELREACHHGALAAVERVEGARGMPLTDRDQFTELHDAAYSALFEATRGHVVLVDAEPVSLHARRSAASGEGKAA